MVPCVVLVLVINNINIYFIFFIFFYIFYKLTSGVDSVDSNRSFSVASNRFMLCCIASLSFLVGVWTRNFRSSLGGVAGLPAAVAARLVATGELKCDRGGET